MMSAAQQMQQCQPRSVGTPGPQGTPVSSASTPLPGPPMNQAMQGAPPQRNVGCMQPPEASKEKLITSVHEFLLLNGGTKTAEALKEEFSGSFPNAKWSCGGEQSPGHLATWWSLFYDLYCAAPERRNDPEMFASAEAKMFHDFGFVPSSFNPPPMMNGMHPQYGTHSPMMGPGPEGMMGGFAGRFAGRAPPHPMGQYMFDPRMQQRVGPGRGQPPAFPGMRPTPPGHPASMAPQGIYRQMMEPCGPGGFPVPPGMMNGGVMGAMPSPGGMPMQGGPPGANPNYMMMPASSSAMPYGGMPQPPEGQSQGGPPSHPGQIGSAHTPINNGPASAGPMPGPSGSGPVAGLINGSDLKQSPAGTPRGNGTPGPGGPGSAAPGSVHSGGAGSVPPPTTQPSEVTPKQEPTEQPQEEEVNEIAKIKNSLIEDFGKEEVPAGGGYGY